jgi:putative membrane protein
MKKSILLTSCFVAAVSCASLYAQASAGGGPHLAGDTIPQADRMFVSQAGAANMAEVALGNLAMSQGQSDAVRNFGNQMITDHTAANVALNNLAGPLGLALAQQPTLQQEQTIDSLKSMSGASFDRHYGRVAVKDHEDAVRLFTQEASFGADPDLRTFAAHMLPTLKHHLSMAHSLPGGGL